MWVPAAGSLETFLLASRVFKEFVEFEEAAGEGGAVGGPFGLAGLGGEGVADGGHLGVHVVHIVEDKGFADHGEFGGAKFVLAVMADEEMLDNGFEIGREILDGVYEVCDGFELEDDVSEELAFGGVADGAIVAELIELSNVVEDCGGKQQVEVEFGIMDGYFSCEAAEADDVFEQAAEISVVHDFSSGGTFVARGDLRIVDDVGGEFFQPGIGDRFSVLLELGVEFSDVFFRVREKIREVDFIGLSDSDLLQ